ncbi:hypothetical protein [Streptomyces griseus]|uniref:hypothetical protein n=1 Tax=Streptomyces griseus TaxID=1911 RepID=UPI003646453B
MTTGLDDAAKAASAALKIWQAASNPLVAVKHGRREDRAATYDRFIALCIKVHHPTEPDGPGDPLLAEELYATFLAIHLRAPRNVRKASSLLCSTIIGNQFEDGLFPFFLRLTVRREHYDPVQADDSAYGPDSEAGQEEMPAEREKTMALLQARRWYKPWTWSSYNIEDSQREEEALGMSASHGFLMSSDGVKSSDDFLIAMAKFTEVARIDVNNRWRWWHWPMALFPPLKHWQLTR